mgnify:CR=1 FL=1
MLIIIFISLLVGVLFGAVVVTSKIQQATGANYIVILGTDAASGGKEKTHIFEVKVYKERYDKLAAGEKTTVRAYTIGDIIDAAYIGG